MSVQIHQTLVAGSFLVALGGTPLANAGEIIFSEDFESGTNNTTVVADRVIESSSFLSDDPGAIARYSNLAAAPATGGSQSLLFQDSALASSTNAPEVFWNLNGGNPLDTTRTIKVSYWHRVASTTQIGGVRDSTQGSVQHVILTGSDASGSRPEGNGNYLAQAWNFTNGPNNDDLVGAFDYEAKADAGAVSDVFGKSLSLDTWYKVENYIPLVDQGGPLNSPGGAGSPAFLGVEDTDNPGEFLGYINPFGTSADRTSVFYARSLNEDFSSVVGQTPYAVRRDSSSTVAGGSNDEFLVRTLQLFGGGGDFMTQFYDDIVVEYVNTADITSVMEGITSGTSDAIYDYDASGLVDETDRSIYVQNVLQTAFGDTNYDFRVDQTDIQVLADNFNTPTSGWENGDLNGDGQVNAADRDLMEVGWRNTFLPDTVDAPDFATAWAAVFGGNNFITGDFNGSGSVEQGDLNLVLNNWGVDTTGNVPDGWLNTDGLNGSVDQAELNTVLNNWGSSAAPSLNGSTVPEPATLSLLALGSLLAVRRR